MSKTYDKSGGHSSEAGDAKGSGQSDASATKSYHNGGVEGDQFSKWFDANLANEVTVMQRPDGAAASESREYQGSGSGGTSGDRHGKDHEWNGKGNGHKGSGSGGTKGSGSGGTKGSGSGGTKGSGSGGTKGSGSGGTKGSGSGGTKGSGSGGTKGSGSGGTKGSGSGGTKGSGSGGTKGSGSGGTKGSGSGGTKGSGSGGTKGSGSGGTKGSGSGGTKGSGSGGTKGSGSGGTKGSGTGGTTSGHGQWGGENAAAAANALPPFEDYEVDSVGTNEITLNDVMSLMTKDMDAVDQDDGNDGTPVDWTGSELL
ncbi:MAG: hypothetical protein ACU0FF_07685 [Sulfitobacter sp.]|uniref:hypothetical protein n=3 Tax=Sulfitobacter sp. TaxID=1903071 RepID=UPI004059A0DB